MKKISPAYVKDFQCMGAECPDTCCHGWTIPLSHVDVQRLNRVNNTIIPIVMEPLTVNPDTSYFAGGLKKDKNGACLQLDKGLCGLQKKYQHNILPSTCQDFPRIEYKNDDYNELYVSFACPKSVELLLSGTVDIEDADFSSLNEIRKKSYTTKDLDDHLYFWSCITQALKGVDLWVILNLWIEDYTKNTEATYQWSDTLLELGVPNIHMDVWYQGQHAMASALFQKYLKKNYSTFQQELLSYIPQEYMNSSNVDYYQKMRERYGQTDMEYEAMRRWLYVEGLRQGILTGDGVSVVKNLAYQWNFIRWLGIGMSISKGEVLELEEWGNAIYMYSRIFQHNGNFQKFLHDLEQDPEWGQPKHVVALIS